MASSGDLKTSDKCSEIFNNMQSEESAETNILYELLIYSEWQQEPEIHGRGLPERVEEKCNQAWRWLGRFAPTSCPSYLVQKLINFQMPWQFAVGGSGRVVAILQDQSLEIRSSRDEYCSVIGRSTVSKDPYPQWRKLVWSPDCTMLVLGYSNGNLEFFDLIGANLFTIAKVKSSGVNGTQDFSQAIAGMVFSDIRVKNTQWSYEFLVANYRGKILSYFVSSTDGHQKNHSFSFTAHYPNGITTLSYHQSSHLLLVGGRPQKVYTSDSTSKALQSGITAWRFLSDYPHYKMVISLEDEMAIGKRSWFQKIPSFGLYDDYGEDTVYKISISPQGDILAAIHTSGALSLWNLPSLRMRKLWDLQLQPNYDVMNPQYCEPGMRRKTASILSDPLRFHIVDVNWWSNEAVIMARCCGAVTISSVYSLKNLLGISPEWFEMSPQVSSFNDRGFLAMECESRVTKKRPAKEDNDNVDGDESSDDEESSIFSHTSTVAKKALYFVTDSEKFQPPRKKPRIVTKTYRLLCLKSTTPEELYTRKINNEEYGEALALAKAYGLDCDLVYQRQWRKTPVSVASIQDYLSKITKRSWVLHECLERVPETIEAARELLLYGLYGTDLIALITIGKGEDHGRFIISHPEEYYDDFYNIYSFTEEELERRKLEQEKKKRLELMKQINFKKLTLEQKQLCQCRLKLLAYLDRLNTYEIILGGSYVAEEHYDHNFFKQFRSQSGLEACLTFAQASNWRAVAAMFTFHGKETLPHRLPILSNFPETTSPVEYHSLLPEIRYKKDAAEVSPWDEDRNREDDWCEIKYSRQLTSPAVQDFIVDFYEEYKDFMKYRQKLTEKLLMEWFSERAREIESRSNLVDNALELVKLGIERNVKGLGKLLDDLTTLETLVYECHVEKKLSFKYFEEISNFEKLQLLMSMCNEENFLKKVKLWLLPFLDRCEKHEPGCRKKLLKEYLKTSAKQNLIYCRKVLENSLPDQPERIISDMEELMSLALDCIYACERNDQLLHACAILECIPQRGYGGDLPKIRSLHDRLDELEKHLSVAELLENNGTSVTLGFILECWQNAEEVKKLLTKLTRIASRRVPTLNEAQWRNLLLDMLDMQEKLFICITPEDCYEIFLQSLLCSGIHDTIALAGCMMECNRKPRRETDLSCHDNFIQSYKLPYLKSVALVLAAAQEHFNSSANLSDPCMALARTCLNLIEDIPLSIEEEHDLISSLSLLQDFNVNVLPLQVRLCPNRLQLVERALKAKAKAYKSTQKLLQLAYLLRVCGYNNKEREGKVLSLIAEAAFTCKDYNHCFSTCQQLIEGGHREGWSVCYSLGGCTEFANIPARCKLMSFSLAHCTPDLIEVILKTRTELQLQIIYDRVKFLMGNGFEHNNKEENEVESLTQECELNDKTAVDGSTNALWQTGEKTLQVLQTTTKTTKAVLTSVGSTQFWKDAVKWIHSFGATWEDDSSGDQLQNNKDLTRQGVCSFYSGLIENFHISKLETSYFRYSRPDLSQSLEITSSVLRAALLEDTLKEESQKSSVNTSVLLDLAKSYLSEDAVFSLAFLLNVKKLQDAEDMLKSLPSTPIVLQFASLYYALRICTRLNVQNVFLQNSEIQEDPSCIIREVIDSTNCEEHIEADAELKEAFNLLHKYNKMLFDFIQAEILHGIGGGVDAMRFTEDDLYKKETILGIAMTLDDDVFQIAVSLAHHYKLPLWDVYMVHLEFLFGESSISASYIEARIQQLKLLEVLLSHVDQFRERLKLCVYPNIEGKNHSRLLLYFFVLELCGDVPDNLGMKPTTHSKMLKKFRSAVSNLDYKELLNPATSSLKYISSLLNEANIHVFAKSATKIPDQDGFLEPSAIYCIWGRKFFFEGSGTNSKIPQLTTEWLHRYESCGNIMQKLTPSHLLEFINGITFTETALEKLSIDCRTEINKRALKFCKQESGKRKDDSDSSQWQIVISELQHNLQHLQRLDDDIIVGLRNSSDPRIQAYAKEFDLSRALTDKLQQMLIKAVMERQELSLLQTLLASCPSDLGWEPAEIYIQSINLVIAQMKDLGTNLHPYLNENNPIDVLEKILQDLSKNNDELMIEDMALELLHPFCNDSSVPVHRRLSVLQLLEKTSTLSEEDTDLLLLYRTQAVVSTVWPEFEVTEDNVKQDFQRKQLFDKLIVASTTVHHLTSLAELLFCWPPLESASSDDPEINLWVQLLCALSSVPEENGLVEIVRLLEEIQSLTTLNFQCCWTVYEKVSEAGILLYILKYAFKTKYDKIHDAGIKHLFQYSELKDEDVDEELLHLVLERHLTSKLVSTVLYKPVIEYLFNHQEDMRHKDYMTVDVVVKELADSNHAAEAGSLLLLLRETHPGLTTFSSALSVLQRWLSRASH